MQFFRTNETVRFPGGTVLLLNRDQYSRRQHLLEPVTDGVTCARQLVEFKAGEIIGLNQVPLALKGFLELVEFEPPADMGELDLEDIVGGRFLAIDDDSIDPETAGERIESSIEQQPDHAEPGEQIQPNSDNLAPVSETKPEARPKGKSK